MKLTLKLTLAFLFVGLIVIGLAAIFIWTTTSAKFTRYLVDQRQAEFVAIVKDFYKVNGGWTGVDSALRSQGLLPPQSKPGDTLPDPQPFALVDQNRLVIIPGGQYKPGQKIQQGILTRGIGIEINGLVVGTVLTTGQSPIPSAIEEKYINSVNQSLLTAAIGGALIAFILGLIIARSFTYPVRDLTAATRAVAQGKLEQYVPVRSADELGELARSFNQMSADLAHANQSRRQMTADIAHDLRNPLTVIGGYLEELQDGKLKPTPERYEIMRVEVQHLQHLVDDLRILSLADAGELTLRRQPVSPGELLEQAAVAYQHQAELQGIQMRTEIPPSLGEINLDREKMEQVIGNLVSNALRFTPEGGEIRLSAKQATGQVILGVEDTGSGIPPEILPHIFERSYRGDPSRSGNESGLGLAIVKSIVELHGGSVQVESKLGKGSRFLLAFPLYEK
jgi:two-component system sensor histidine kinase BaeS